MERGNIEWLNTWIAKANEECGRCLLIGDSVTRNIRSKLELYLVNWLAVDLFACLYDLTDDLFWKNLEVFMTQGGTLTRQL